MHPAQRKRIDLRAEPAEHRRKERHRRREHEGDADHDPERHRAERGTRHEHHRGQRDEDRKAREQHRFPGGVHRDRDRVPHAELGTEVGAAETIDDEQRVIDPERQREHQREVHRPDRDLEAMRQQRQQPGRGEQPEDCQHQRQPGRDQRAEGDRKDRQGDRPGVELRLHHRRTVRGVEVRPHPGRAGQADRDRRCRECVQLALQAVGGGDHRGRIAPRTGDDDRGMTVGRDRRPRLRRHDGRDAPVGTQHAFDLREQGLKRRVTDGDGGRVEHDHRSRAGEPGEVLLDQACARRPTRSRSPANPHPTAPSRPAARRPPATTATTAQASATARRWSAAQPPRRPTGPTASGCSGIGGGYGRCCCDHH